MNVRIFIVYFLFKKCEEKRIERVGNRLKEEGGFSEKIMYNWKIFSFVRF